MAEANTAQSSQPDNKPAASANKPDAKAKSGADSAPKAKAAAKGSGGKAKKEKPPAVEDKPFPEFMENHFVPALADAFKEEGIDRVTLDFQKSKLAVKGADAEDYWQVTGQWPEAGERHFNIVFTQEDIKAPKFFYYTQGSSPASTVEQFMGDERRITMDLMVLYTLQRLNGQKWLSRN